MKKIIFQALIILVIILEISAGWSVSSYGATSKSAGNMVVVSPPSYSKTIKNNQLVITVEDNDGIDANDIKVYKYKQGTNTKSEITDKKLITRKVIKTQNGKNIKYECILSKETISDSSNLFLLSLKNKLDWSLETEILVNKLQNGQYKTNNAPKVGNLTLKNNSKVEIPLKDGGQIKKAIVYDLNNNNKQVLSKTNLGSSNTLSLDISSLKEDAARTATYNLKLHVEDQKATKSTSTFSFQLPKTTRTVDKQSVSLPVGDRIYFLDAQYQEKTGEQSQHGGDTIIIESGGHYGLIDSGRKTTYKRVVDNLISLGITKLDFVLLTHMHTDHAKGYIDISKSGKVKIENLYIGNYNKIYDANGKEAKNLTTEMQNCKKLFNDVIAAARAQGTNIRYVQGSTNNKISFNNGHIIFNLYNTTLHNVDDENANSIVALTTINGRKIYFEADLQDISTVKKSSNSVRVNIANTVKKVDVLKVAHHGRYSENGYATETFAILKPTYSVFTNYVRSSNLQTRTALNKTTRGNNYFTANGTTILTIDSSGKMTFTQLKDTYNWADSYYSFGF